MRAATPGIGSTVRAGSFEKLVGRWRAEEEEGRARAQELRRRALEDARPVFVRYGVERAVLFGSVAQGRCRKSSDIDLLVMPLAAADYWACWRELEDAVGAPVDLHTDAEDPVFVQQVLLRGETIYAA